MRGHVIALPLVAALVAGCGQRSLIVGVYQAPEAISQAAVVEMAEGSASTTAVPTEKAVFQIYRIDADGGNPVNISGENSTDQWPSVHEDGKEIVFTVGGSETAARDFYVMDVRGNNRLQVPLTSTVFAWNPAWTRGGDHKILLDRGGNIWRVSKGGGDETQLTTSPGWDGDAASADVAHIVFVRCVQFGSCGYDLYVKDVAANGTETALTDTADVDEINPAVSHDGKLLAYVVRRRLADDDKIIIAEFVGPTNIKEKVAIPIRRPAHGRIMDIDFAENDLALYFVAFGLDDDGKYIGPRLFRVKLDGAEQEQISDMHIFSVSVVP